ncbi:MULTISPECIES: helix-turn-helix domain-containing protein [unclassified Arthrobacter]|uniref:helix-turn-helix domain-containing protein n=1 Tax=unclassified Arthrobacter TaxID=235627 RepID=UPI001C8614D2|nr:helix-turn-helix domain-containing protein [Arthrobacter sp. MAHUQ-56]MBX7445451.1 helix-turn-helix domain-containing protein [Arthrobacter sp. MAHUQ-56]
MDAAAPELANLTDAGKRYKCSPRTIRRMIDRGDLTAYRVGPKLLRIDIREADRVFTAAADER